MAREMRLNDKTMVCAFNYALGRDQVAVVASDIYRRAALLSPATRRYMIERLNYQYYEAGQLGDAITKRSWLRLLRHLSVIDEVEANANAIA